MNINSEQWQNDLEQMDMISRKIIQVIKSFLEDFTLKCSNSETLQSVVSRHDREQVHLLKQNLENAIGGEERVPSIMHILIEFKNFTHLLTDQTNGLINEFLTAKNEAKIMEMKIESLENKLAQYNYSDKAVMENKQYLQNEIDHQRQ